MRESFGEPELCGVFVVAIIGAHGGMTRHASYGSDPFVAPARALSGELGPLSRSKKRAGPERRFGAFVAICEGRLPRLQQRQKFSASNGATAKEAFAKEKTAAGKVATPLAMIQSPASESSKMCSAKPRQRLRKSCRCQKTMPKIWMWPAWMITRLVHG